MISLSDLQAEIEACVDGSGTLLLPGNALGSPTMEAAFATYLTDDELVVLAATFQTTSEAVIVTGQGGGRFGKLAVTATFTPTASDDVMVVVSGTTPAGWLFSSAFAGLIGGIYDNVPIAQDGTMVLRTLPAGDLPIGLYFDGSLLVAGVVGGVPLFLTSSLPVPVSGAIDVVSELPKFNFSAPVAQKMNVGTIQCAAFTLGAAAVPYPFDGYDFETGQTATTYIVDGYAFLSTSLDFTTKAGPMSVAVTMRIGSWTTASLQVAIDGSVGVLLDAFQKWAVHDLGLGLPDPALFNPSDYLTIDSLIFNVAPATASLSSFSVAVSTIKEWVVIPDVITVTKVDMVLTSTDPAGAATISGLLSGNVDLGQNGDVAKIVVRGFAPSFAFFGALQPDCVVDVSTLIEYLIPGTTGLPSITLDSFQFFCQPSTSPPTYSLDAVLTSDWVLDVSPVQMAITSATVAVGYGPSGSDGGNPGSTTTGSVGGTIVFNDTVSFEASYALPGSFKIAAQTPSLSLLASVARLANMPLHLPSGFDLQFTDCSIAISYGDEEPASNLQFEIGARVDGLGVVAFEALKIGTLWGYVAGLNMGDVALSNVPGLSALAPFVAYFSFSQLTLVVSTADMSDFAFAWPGGSPAAPTPDASSAAQSIVAGMNAYAKIDLTSQADLSLLMKFLDLSAVMSITLQIGLDSVADGSALYASIAGEVNSDISLTGQFGAKLVGGILELYASGTVAATIQGQPLLIQFMLAFEPNGAFLSGGYTGTIDFVIVKLSNLFIEIGIDFEGIPTIGFAAQIDGSTYDTSVMVLLDSINPAQSMFVAAISDISLGTFLRTLCNVANVSGVPSSVMEALDATGISGTNAFRMADTDDTVSAALDARDVAAVSRAFATAGISLPSDPQQVLITVAVEGARWYVTDIKAVLHYQLAKSGAGQDVLGTLEAQLYVVPQATQLGPTLVAQGYRANATLNLFGFTAAVSVEIADQLGLQVDVAFSKMVIAVNGFPVFSFASADGSTGPWLSVSSFQNDANPDPSKRPPHFFATGSVAVLGVISSAVTMSFSAAGGAFSATASISSVATYEFSGSYRTMVSFSLEGSATIGVDQTFDFGTLGKVHFDASVGYAYSVAVESATNGSASAKGTFSFAGTTFAIATFPLPLDTDSLSNLVKEASDQVYAALQTFFEDYQQWMNCLYAGLVEGVQSAEQVGQILESVYALSYDVIGTQTSQILHYSTDQVTQALQGAGATADEAYAVLVKDLGVPASEATAAVEDFFTGKGDHIDIPHADSKGAHVDNNHTDSKGAHVDDGHTDSKGAHVDYKMDHDDAHADLGSLGHSHTDKRPHDDTSAHYDTPHDDTSAHYDTPHDDTSAHYDTPHSDFNA